LTSDYTLQRVLNTSTGLSDVIVRWKDTAPADTSTLIERASSAGVWSTLVTLGPLDGPQAYTDRNLPADSEWCYRIRIRGANNAEVLTLPRCAVTQKTNDIGVFRTQLRIRVANVSNGGTDGRVAVALQGGPFDITTLRDIMRVGVYTGSTDAFCVSQIQLIVNTAVALDRTWGNTAATCEWVDGYNAIYISHDELRASPQFVNFQSPVMSPLVEADELESRLQAVVGTLIFERLDVDWRNPGVAVSRLTDNAVRASVDFPWWEDVLVVIIDPVCVPATAIAGAAFEDCMSQLEKYIAKEIKKGFDIPSKRIPVVLPDKCVTPQVTVLSDGALFFSCAQARTTTTKGTTVLKGLVPAARPSR
jgi:hypothetical protein